MDIQKLISFFKWCTIINGVLLVYSVIMLVWLPDFIYDFHGQMFSLSRESFDVIIYAFIGLYKIFFIVFNVVPWAALVIVRNKS